MSEEEKVHLSDEEETPAVDIHQKIIQFSGQLDSNNNRLSATPKYMSSTTLINTVGQLKDKPRRRRSKKSNKLLQFSSLNTS